MQIKDITQADRLDQTRRDFVANVSHELRTPLTVLAGFLETMQEIELPEEERQRYPGHDGRPVAACSPSCRTCSPCLPSSRRRHRKTRWWTWPT